jgi:hypothetical protein
MTFTSALALCAALRAAGASFPPVPDGGVAGPFNVLTSGLSVLNYTNLVTALALHNAPGGMTAKWPGSNMTVHQMVRS